MSETLRNYRSWWYLLSKVFIGNPKFTAYRFCRRPLPEADESMAGLRRVLKIARHQIILRSCCRFCTHRGGGTPKNAKRIADSSPYPGASWDKMGFRGCCLERSPKNDCGTRSWIALSCILGHAKGMEMELEPIRNHFLWEGLQKTVRSTLRQNGGFAGFDWNVCNILEVWEGQRPPGW